MADFSLADLAGSVGTRTGNFLKDIANASGNFVCGLYRDYAGNILGQPALPAPAFAKGLWDSLCNGRSLPAPPSVPFKGGQCAGVRYTARVAYTYNPSIGEQQSNTFGGTYGDGTVIGPVKGCAVVYDAASDLRYGVQVQGANNTHAWVVRSVPNTTTCRMISVATYYGQADNCGDLPATYPITPIPSERMRTTVNYTYNDGTTVVVPVVYRPDISLFPIAVDVGGVTLTFDFSGAKFGLGTDSADLRKIEDALKRLESSVKNVRDALPVPKKPPSSGAFDQATTSEDTSDEKTDMSGLQWVQIELTRMPTNAKKQYGGAGQDVIYAGWFEFIIDGLYLPREPIHFKRSVFSAPAGATGYAYTLYEGYACKVTEIKKKPTDNNTYVE